MRARLRIVFFIADVWAPEALLRGSGGPALAPNPCACLRQQKPKLLGARPSALQPSSPFKSFKRIWGGWMSEGWRAGEFKRPPTKPPHPLHPDLQPSSSLRPPTLYACSPPTPNLPLQLLCLATELVCHISCICLDVWLLNNPCRTYIYICIHIYAVIFAYVLI